MAQEVILTCAVSGSHDNHHRHPDFPITPKQIAQACLDARSAGADVVQSGRAAEFLELPPRGQSPPPPAPRRLRQTP